MNPHHFFSGRSLFHLLVLAVLTFLVYANSLSNGFVWDDLEIIVRNPKMSGAGNMPDLLLSEDTFIGTRTGFYRPITYLTFFFDRAVWNLEPFGFHLHNLLLHIGVALSCYLLFSLIFRDHTLAFFSSLIFALHPVNSETVNFLSGGRNTLLSALFMLLAFIFFIRQKRVLSVISFSLSIFSKEFGLLLPVLLYFYDSALRPPDERGGEKTGIIYYLPWFAAIAVYLLVRTIAIEGSGIRFDLPHLLNRLMMLPEIIVTYLKVLLLPVQLKIPYVIRPPRTFDLRAGLYTTGLIMIVTALFSFRKSPAILFALFWILLFFLPVANLIPLGHVQMAERYAYFSSIGFSLLLGYFLLRGRGIVRYLLLAVLCLSFSIIVIKRNPVWKDNEAFYAGMISDAPEASMGYYNFGMVLSAKGETEMAIPYLEKAVSAYPSTPNSMITLGGFYLEGGNQEKAMELLNKALLIDPGNLKGLIMLSRLYETQGDRAAASAAFQKVTALFPDAEKMLKEKALSTCISAEEQQAANNMTEAERLFRRALLYDPYSSRALLGLGSAIAQRGDLDTAISHFIKASELEPDNPIPHYNLSLAYRLKGMIRESEAEMNIYMKLKRTPARK